MKELLPLQISTSATPIAKRGRGEKPLNTTPALQRVLMVLLWISLAMAPAAYAFDDVNAGIYAVVHKDGHTTEKVFRVVRKDSGWSIEDKLESGEWKEVTCDGACILQVSTADEIEYLMGAGLSDGMTGECLHNMYFGFCATVYDDKPERSYVMVANADGRIVPMRLKRIGDIRQCAKVKPVSDLAG